MTKCGIYKIKNIVNNNVYIGSSVDITKRWRNHRWDLNNKKHANCHLQRAWDLYGEINFEFSIVEICKEENLLDQEQYYINEINPTYNILPLAGRTIGVIRSEEYKQKFIGNKYALGYKHNKESIEKIRQSSLGRKRSPESIEKQRQRNIGNKYALGTKREDSRIRMMGNKYGINHKHTEEWKVDARNRIKDFWNSKEGTERKEMLKEKMIGNKYGTGNKGKIGHKHTEESKHKMSIVKKKYWEGIKNAKDTKNCSFFS